MVPRSNLSLGRKIGLLTLVALVLGLGLFSILALQSVNESLQRTLQERLAIARIVANRLDQTLNYILVQLHSTASLSESLPSSEEFDRAVASLRDIFRQSEISVNTVYALDRGGNVVRVEPADTSILGFPMSAYSEIRRNLEAGQPGVSGLVSKPLAETPVVLFSIPVRDQSGLVAWVLACSVDVERSGIGTFTQTIEIGKSGYIEIVDGNGIVMARTNPGTPPALFELSDHPTRFAELIATGQATVGKCHRCHTGESGTQKGRDVLAFAPLSTVSWGVAIRQSEEEALAPTRQLEMRLLFLGTILVVSTLALVVTMNQNIVKPIRMLTTAANRLATNDYEADVPAGRGDEIGQLSAAFQVMRNELKKSRSEMVSRYEEAKHREELRGQLLNSVIDAQEQERRRIARELHDEYGQTLTGLIMSIEATENSLSPEQSRLRERLANTKSVVSRAIDEMRRLILDLRPPSLDELGLVSAVKTYVQHQLGEMDIKITFESRGITGRLPSTLEVTVFRIIQEAVHNIAKHAHARNVRIDLSIEDGKIITVVKDDGKGFNASAVLASGTKTHSWGILGIRERTSLMGGTFNLKSEKGWGTRLEIEIPINEWQWDSKTTMSI